MAMARLVISTVVIVLLASCEAQQKPDPNGPTEATSRAPIIEDPTELRRLQARVEEGDQAAAAVLALHYEFANESDPETRIHWLRQSAETGDAGSMTGLAAFQVVRGECEEASEWFERWWTTRSASERDAEAEGDIEAYRNDVAACRTLKARRAAR